MKAKLPKNDLFRKFTGWVVSNEILINALEISKIAIGGEERGHANWLLVFKVKFKFKTVGVGPHRPGGGLSPRDYSVSGLALRAVAARRCLAQRHF
jgi:hypothetical protein